MKFLILFGLFFLVNIGLNAQSVRPNLVLTRQGVLALQDNLNKYPLLQSSYEALKRSVDLQLLQKMDVPVPKDQGGGYTHEKHRLNSIALYNAGILWQVSHDEKYARFMKDMFLAYAKLYPTLKFHPEGKNSSAPGRLFWQSLNDAVWLVYVAQAFDCLADYLQPAERKMIIDNVLIPASKFQSEDNSLTYNKIHNHGTWAVAAVAMVGYAIGDKEMVEKSILGSNKDGKSGFLAQMKRLFSPDGMYLEGPYYQRYAIMPFILFAKVIQNNQPERNIFAYKDSVLVKASLSLLQMTTANGFFLPLNDDIKDKNWNSAELMYATNIVFNDFRKDQSLLFIAKQQKTVMMGIEGVAVAKAISEMKTSPIFSWKPSYFTDGEDGKHGGLAILRMGKGDNMVSLLLKHGEYGMEHGHFDKLTISLYDGESEILRDYGSARFLNVEQKQGGRYLPENKTWAKQTIAHNTVTIDEKSNYGAKSDVADKLNSYTWAIQLNDSNLQIASAKDTSAYSGVEMHRTVALLKPSGYTKPFAIDIYRIKSKKKCQADLNFNMEGQFIDGNIPFQTPATLSTLGKSYGYQHLWEMGRGMSKESTSYSTWFLNDRFYTISTATDYPTELIFTRLGANDPKFNLRNEQSFILRKKDTTNFVFATVLQIHGNYNGTAETVSGLRSNIASIKVIENSDDQTVILITENEGKQWIFAVVNNEALKNKSKKIKVLGTEISLKETFFFQELQKK